MGGPDLKRSSESSTPSAVDADPPGEAPAPGAPPLGVRVALISAAAQAALGGILALLLVPGILVSGGGFGGAILFAGFLLIAPYALAFGLLFRALRRRSRWAPGFGLILCGGFAVLLAQIWMDEPEAYVRNFVDAFSAPTELTAFMVAWVTLIFVNAVPAVLIARRNERAWFGLTKWWWQRLRFG